MVYCIYVLYMMVVYDSNFAHDYMLSCACMYVISWCFVGYWTLYLCNVQFVLEYLRLTVKLTEINYNFLKIR